MEMETPMKPTLNVNYLAFSIDTDEDAATIRFIERFGQPPEYIFEDGLLLLLGPIPVGDVIEIEKPPEDLSDAEQLSLF